jgi:hypothetical protein
MWSPFIRAINRAATIRDPAPPQCTPCLLAVQYYVHRVTISLNLRLCRFGIVLARLYVQVKTAQRLLIFILAGSQKAYADNDLPHANLYIHERSSANIAQAETAKFD